MTQEEKDLLLRDLSARLSYGVKVLCTADSSNEICELDSIMTSRKHKNNIFVGLTLPDDSIMTGIEMVKPYLRSLSSMTEEEYKELYTIEKKYYGLAPIDSINDWSPNTETINYLNAHYFDYRGLIDEKGLALEAPEGMYKIAI